MKNLLKSTVALTALLASFYPVMAEARGAAAAPAAAGSVATGTNIATPGMNTGINAAGNANIATNPIAGTGNNINTMNSPGINTGINAPGNANGSIIANTATTNTTATGTTVPTATNSTVNWNAENAYWRNNYASRPYYNSHVDYSTYEPAYQYGATAYGQYGGRRFEDLDQARLRRDWEKAHGNSNLTWDQAQAASRDAYMRLYENNLNTTSTTTPAVPNNTAITTSAITR